MSGESRSVQVRLSLDVARAIAESKAFGTEFTRAMEQAERSTRRVDQATDQIASTAGHTAAAAAAAFGVMVGAAANFDQAMSKVQAATHETADNMDLLRETAIQAGRDTQYSATEAAAGIEALAKAGVGTSDILDGGLSGALDLAAAGGLEVADAAETAAMALTQFRLSGEQVPHVADLLAAGAGKAQGDVTDLAMALKQSGLVASQMGLSIEETTGTLAAFAAQGLLGSDAGTSFKTMLQALTPNSQEAAATMAELGLEFYDAQGRFVGLEEVAGQLQSALSGLSEEQRNAALKTIFGSDAVRAAAVLYREGADGVAEWTDKVNEQGYAAETAAIKMDNLRGDLEKLKGSLETAFIGAGGGAQDPLRDVTQSATNAVDAFSGLPPEVQGTATTLAGLAAVLGGSLWVGSKAARGLAETRDAMTTLRAEAPRTAGAFTALGNAFSIATLVIAATQALDSFERSSYRAAPAVSALTERLLDLGDARSAQDAVAQLGDLRAAIDATSDPSLVAQWTSFTDKWTFGVGSHASKVLPLFGNAVSDAKRQTAEATDTIQALDSALTSIANQGSPKRAALVLEQLAAVYGLNRDELARLTAMLPDYSAALADQRVSAELSADATADSGVAARKAAADYKELKRAVSESRDDARKTAATFTGLGDSLDDSKVSLGGWITELEKQARALNDFRENAAAAGKRGLRDGLIKDLEDAGQAGALRMQQLADASQAEIRRANRAWGSMTKATNDYVDAVGGVPPAELDVDATAFNRGMGRAEDRLKTFDGDEANPFVDLYTARFDSEYDSAVRKLNALDGRQVTVGIRAISAGIAGASGGLFGGTGSADGGSVPKTGLPYADRHAYLLADGEEVISNRYGQADRHRPLLKAINAGRLADGGTAGLVASTHASTDPATRAVSAFARAVTDATIATGKETRTREELLQREVDRAQKAADAADDRVRAVRDEIATIRQNLQANLTSDLFQSDGQSYQSAGGALPDGFNTWDPARQKAYLQQATQAEYAANLGLGYGQITSPNDVLRGDIKQAKQLNNLVTLLSTGRGAIGGQALAELVQQALSTGNLGQLEAYANDPKLAQQYERLFNARERYATGAGGRLADASLGGQKDAAVAELREANRELRQVQEELKELQRVVGRQGREFGEELKSTHVKGSKGR